MSIASKIKTITWYISRPAYYSQLPGLIRQRLLRSDKENSGKKSEQWCSARSLTTGKAIEQLTGNKTVEAPETIYAEIFREAHAKENDSPIKMGGGGNLSLLYTLCEHLQVKEVIETGVAYGWSSLAILLSLSKRDGKLNSIDMPYAKMGNENYVGMVVPGFLRKNWTLIRLPDRKGLKIALDNTQVLDLVHYDSDKSYDGRMFAYPLLWNALRKGGILISDDIQDNLGFHDFCKQKNLDPVIVEFNSKYVGVLKK